MEVKVETTLQKWGNSLGLRMPSVIVKSINLKQGSELEIRLKDGAIILIPKKNKQLSELLSQINPYNIHSEKSFGKSVGREVW